MRVAGRSFVKFTVIAFCLILVPAACATQANPPEQGSKPSMQGRVLQEPDGPPIRKANVQLNGLPEPGLAGSGRNDLILHMQPAAIITGKIVDLDGDAMRGVGVIVTRVGASAGGRTVHSFGNAATDDLGEFRISELRAGRYKVMASPPQG